MLTVSAATSSWMSLLLIALALLLNSPRATHAALQFHDFRSAYLREQSPRALQTSGGTLPDLIAPSSDCYTQGGLEFACLIHQRVGTPEDYVDLNATVVCELGVAQFDFRRANGCSCSVLITPSNTSKIPKNCPCTVCPIDFGSSSLSLDCSRYLPSEAPSMAPSSEGDIGTADQTMPPSTAETTMAPSISMTMAPTSTSMTQPPTTGSMTQTPTAATDGALTNETVSAATAGPTPAGTVISPFLTTAPTALETVAMRRWLQDEANATIMTNTTNETAVPDPFIFATCVTIDCGGNCNGTCSLGCDYSGEQCAFCEGGAGKPTASPTGAGDGTIQELSGAAAVSGCAWLMVVMTMLATAATFIIV
ncbi:hypothetical protein MPSEU_000038800 [Mayamaea pseudoterrestris]|nr:hypothetical protein MPSEU_000038800 [Mayamaea pseudoterrestris]